MFDACQQEPNSIPLAKLASYSEYRRERYGLQKWLLVIILLVFLALPFCFIAPEFTLTKQNSNALAYVQYEVAVDSRLPVSYVAASVDGESVYVSEIADKVYVLKPTRNGTMKIKVSLLNKQFTVKEVEVTDIDTEAPVLLDYEIRNGRLTLFLDDNNAGIDYDKITAVSGNGNDVPAEQVGEGFVTFRTPQSGLDIRVPDKKGNTLQLVISIPES